MNKINRVVLLALASMFAIACYAVWPPVTVSWQPNPPMAVNCKDIKDPVKQRECFEISQPTH